MDSQHTTDAPISSPTRSAGTEALRTTAMVVGALVVLGVVGALFNAVKQGSMRLPGAVPITAAIPPETVSAWEGETSAFLAARCEYSDAQNLALLQGAINAVAKIFPDIGNAPLLTRADSVARIDPRFKPIDCATP